MGENPAQIEREIELRRERLGRNIKNLQQRVGDMRNWRKQFERRPLAFLGAAFGAAFALALMIPNGNGRSHGGWSGPRGQGRPERNSIAMNRALQAWEDVKGALVGVAIARFTELLAEALPGFEKEYRKSEAKQSATYAL
jgi:hypothetical protein